METILDIRDLCVEFKTAEGTVKAVNNLSYTLHKGEKLGIVGESGSGKSVSSLGIMQLIPNPPGQITNGSILYRDKDLVTAEEKEMQKIRGNEISMIFSGTHDLSQSDCQMRKTDRRISAAAPRYG